MSTLSIYHLCYHWSCQGGAGWCQLTITFIYLIVSTSVVAALWEAVTWGITSSLSCEQLVPTPIGLSRSIFPRHPFSQFSNYFLPQASDKPSKSYTTACTLYSTILDMYTYSSLPLLLDTCLPLWEKDCENHYHTYLGFLVLLHRNIFSFSLQG